MPTLIQQYSIAMMHKLALEAAAIAPMEHGPLKGQYREIFVHTVLTPLLSSQFGIGTGLIINQRGDQSHQQDVILYDKRILPPFIASGSLGVFPVESVLATIEVKSEIDADAVEAAEIAAQRVAEIARDGSIYPPAFIPRAALIGFRAAKYLELPNDKSCHCLNITQRLLAVCCVGKFSWLREECGFDKPLIGSGAFEETRQFVAVILDNLRTDAEQAYGQLLAEHRDWFSA